MHFHADHPLFFGSAKPLPATCLRLGLVACIVVGNAWIDTPEVSLAGLLLATALLYRGWRRSPGRLSPLLAWTLTLVAGSLAASMLLSVAAADAARIGLRMGCGVAWLLWLGTQVDWPSLRRVLLASRVPPALVGSLDHGILHGALTIEQWQRRRDAARLRLGRKRLPLPVWSALLGDGSLAALERLEEVEQRALLRGCAALRSVVDAPALVLDELRVAAGDRVLLDRLTLSVAPGEWVAILGPSGAGKTSLLRTVAGLHETAAGTMRRLGIELASRAPLADRLDGRVGLLTQNPEHHFLASTVEEDIAWGLLQRGTGTAEAHERARAVANRLGIDRLLGRACHTLSFGEQRRAALAGILAQEPEVLLLDEPTSGLDPVAAWQLGQALEAEAGRRAVACLWSTHDLTHLPDFVQRIVLLRDGRVLFDGPRQTALTLEWLRAAGLARDEDTNLPLALPRRQP